MIMPDSSEGRESFFEYVHRMFFTRPSLVCVCWSVQRAFFSMNGGGVGDVGTGVDGTHGVHTHTNTQHTVTLTRTLHLLDNRLVVWRPFLPSNVQPLGEDSRQNKKLLLSTLLSMRARWLGGCGCDWFNCGAILEFLSSIVDIVVVIWHVLGWPNLPLASSCIDYKLYSSC